MKSVSKLSLLLLIAITFSLVACSEYDGSEITMYYTDSVPKIEVFYKYYGNELYVSKEIRYYPNGRISEEGSYTEKGLKNGLWTYYFENGEKWLEENYSDGKKHGKTTEWYKSGKKMYVANYKYDLPNGKWIIWNEDGQKISTQEYNEGTLVE